MPSLKRRHLVFGWWTLATYMSVGLLLEALWAFRFNWYVSEAHAMRRLLWRLAHAHGTLFALIHIGFAASISMSSGKIGRSKFASACLLSGSLLMPGGFFLGGVYMQGNGGDPGIGIFLAPVGAILMLLGVLITAREATSVSDANG